MAESDSTPRYRIDQYDSVYRRTGNAYVFVAKLNGRTPEQAIADLEDAEAVDETEEVAS